MMRSPGEAAARLLASVVLAAAASSLPADTPVSGTISASSTWAQSGSPFIVTGDVLVEGPAAPVLTIEAGVSVRVNSGKKVVIGKNAPGKLLAAGTASRPISFSANSASPTAGYWQGIFFYAQAASGSKISETTVEYAGFNGGWDGSWGGVSVNGSSPTLQNLTVRNCVIAGITIGAGSPVITGLTLIGNPVGLAVSYPATPSLQTAVVSNSAGFAMSVDARVTFAALTGLSFSGNGTNAIGVRGGTVDVNTTWRNGGVPYVLEIPLVVDAANKPILTIKPGVALRFNQGTFLQVGRSLGGGLSAVGTASDKILFGPNSASPGAGFWQGILFDRATLSTSKIAYASVSYGGSGDSVNGYKGGITISNAAPTLQNILVQNSLIAGIRVIGGSPGISGSTISGNPVGLWFAYPGAPSLQTSTLSGNSGFAISMDGQVSFASLSALTLSGNGTDAIEIRNGRIGVNTTWKNGGVPYIVNTGVQVEGAAKPVLTIEPGVTLKFSGGAPLLIGDNGEGGISAVGTDSERITFTTSSPNPWPSTYAGLWGGIQLRSRTLPGSTIAYASVAYAGLADSVNGFRGGIHVVSSSPVLDHVRFETNTYAGLSVSLGSPTITNCDFKAAGLINQSPAQPIAAMLNWWGTESGPAGAGPGTGQPVSGGVRFEPWLTAPASAPQFVSAFALKNSIFNPSIGVNATLAFSGSSAKSASWRATFAAGGSTVRTIAATGTSVTLVWDGKDGAGGALPGGTYSYKLETTSGTAASPVFGRIVIDRSRQLTVSGFGLAPAFFSPNGDGVQDTTTLTGSASFDGAVWAVKVKNAGGTAVRTATGAAEPAIAFTWDGKSDSNTIQPDGVYTLELTVTDGGQTATAAAAATADRTIPVAGISAPAAGAVLSNVYQNGSADVDVAGTGTDANFKSWLLEFGSGSTPSSWAQISSGTLPVSGAKLATWPTAARPVGTYTLRLQVSDLAGNTAITARTLTVGNFGMSMNSAQFNGSSGGTVTYISTVPFPLTETITIKNTAGQTVRTLFSGSRAAGTFTDAWNGHDGQGGLLPDGPYFYTAVVASGGSSIVWDLGGVYSTLPNDFLCQAWVPVTTFQPFNNQFLPLSYTLTSPARTWMIFSVGWYDCNTPGPPLAACADPDKFCFPNGEYQESGLHSGWWAGVDPAGAFRGNIGSVAVLARRDNFSRNAVVLFGSKPVLTNLAVQPPAFNPAFGAQTISFDVSSFQSRPVNVSVTARNQESLTVLRTVTATAQPAGRMTVLWDGHADNGLWASPGAYTLTVTVSDAIGNAVSRQALMSISY